MHKNIPSQDNDLEQLARKHASAKLGWYIHASIYVAVNLMLVLMSVMGGRHWAVFPLLGWGLGLAIHGIVVLLHTGRFGLHERMVQRERERLARRDTW
jgi:hypothetical protein